MIETISEHKSFGGTTGYYKHASQVNDCEMRFAVFVPESAKQKALPALTFLAGLTCTEETFMIKAGAQRVAAELGLVLVAPDTSPRGEGVADDPDQAYDLGLGAGFYLDATETPWSAHYNMYSYITRELPEVLAQHFPIDAARQGIFGHSMGGHGALTLGLRHPELYQSISAFAPICNPLNCTWGEKAFTAYLGSDQSRWQAYDATELVRQVDVLPANPVLIDQGESDEFLAKQLNPDVFELACRERDVDCRLRRHAGYDHGYFFIASFVEDHLRHHAAILCR